MALKTRIYLLVLAFFAYKFQNIFAKLNSDFGLQQQQQQQLNSERSIDAHATLGRAELATAERYVRSPVEDRRSKRDSPSLASKEEASNILAALTYNKENSVAIFTKDEPQQFCGETLYYVVEHYCVFIKGSSSTLSSSNDIDHASARSKRLSKRGVVLGDENSSGKPIILYCSTVVIKSSLRTRLVFIKIRLAA